MVYDFGKGVGGFGGRGSPARKSRRRCSKNSGPRIVSLLVIDIVRHDWVIAYRKRVL